MNRLPLVLCHGLLGFSTLGPFDYFRNIKRPLEELGCDVFFTVVPPTSSISQRAHTLRNQLVPIIQQTKRKVHIIAHSMGGLDSRYLISKLDGHEMISSLTTLSSPHRGSTIAEWVDWNIGRRLRVEKVFNFLDIPYDAFHQLSPKFMIEEFNPHTPDVDGIKYFSWAAGKERMPIVHPLYLFERILRASEGLNDGLVSVESAKWGEYKGCIACDHLELINWSPTYNASSIYEGVVRYLRDNEKVD